MTDRIDSQNAGRNQRVGGRGAELILFPRAISTDYLPRADGVLTSILRTLMTTNMGYGQVGTAEKEQAIEIPCNMMIHNWGG